jgi:protein O-GlcNAc transferase
MEPSSQRAEDSTTLSAFVARVRAARSARADGHFETAIREFRTSLELEPRAAAVWSMLSNVLREAGHSQQALDAAERALAIDPRLPEAHLNEGAALHAAGRTREAVVSYRLALTFPETSRAARANLALALRAQATSPPPPGWQLLLRSLQEAANAELWLALGRYLRKERPASAIACYERSVALGPTGCSLRELAVVLWQNAHFDAARERMAEAVEFEPNEPLGYRMLGSWLAAPCSLLDGARWERLLERCPDDPVALGRLTAAVRRHGLVTLSRRLAERSVQIAPERAEGYLSLSAALADQGCAKEAVQACERGLVQNPELWGAHSNLLFSLHLDPDVSAVEIFERHCAFGRALQASVRAEHCASRRCSEPERTLRIGYVSPDFCAHAVSYFIEPVLQQHDRGAFDVTCYSDVTQPDAVTERLATTTRLVPCGAWSHQTLAERIAADAIDILVDLAGHTGRNRLPAFARRPSPIQLSWLGYFDTTGVEAIDYRLADAHSFAPSMDAHFVERVVRLPRSVNCFLAPPGPEPRAAPELSRGKLTFGCFNNPAKINRRVVSVFARILRDVEGAELVLKYRAFNDRAMRARYHEWFAAEGVAPERVRMVGSSGVQEFMEAVSDVDIALDPFPYGGETTALHTLWMGVPVVTLEGPMPMQRLTSRVLRWCGLSEWIAQTEDEYVTIVERLVRAQPQRQAWRRTLRGQLQASPLCDHRGITRDLEATYRELWRQHCCRADVV